MMTAFILYAKLFSYTAWATKLHWVTTIISGMRGKTQLTQCLIISHFNGTS